MPYRLRKLNPPFGTEAAPLMEYAYSEQVKVVDGVCDVKDQATRDYLVKMGYEDLTDVAPHPNGSSGPVPAESVIPKKTVPHPKKKKKRRR